MSASEIEWLKVYVLLSPALVCAVALGVVWLTGWMVDRREERHGPAE